MDELYRGENVAVRRVPTAQTNRWVVTFDSYDIGHGFDRPGFGEAFLQSRGISAIHVMGRREDWYQYAEMGDALHAVRLAVSGAERVMTYGSSMGGYAAVRFADRVGADAVLACSPQYSIDPRKNVIDNRWSQDANRIAWRPEIDGTIVCAARPVLVFDPNGPDGWHAERISADVPITAIRLPYTGHPVTTYLNEIELLEPLLRKILDDDLDAEDFGIEARRRRRDSVVYLNALAVAQPAWRPRTAQALARRANTLSPDNPSTHVGLARLLTQSGDHANALALLRQAIAVDRSPAVLVPYAEALLASGDFDLAAALTAEVVAARPDLAHLHAWQSHVLWGCGAHGDAVSALEIALRLDPANGHYQALMAFYRPAPSNEPPPETPRQSLWRRAVNRATTLAGGIRRATV